MSHESSEKEAKIQAQLIVDEAVLKAIKSNSDQVDTIVNESTVINTELIADSHEVNSEQLVRDEDETKTSISEYDLEDNYYMILNLSKDV